MLTPSFSLKQDDDFITVHIRAPFLKTQQVEFYVEGSEFKFYAKPYFLRLHFPGNLVEDGREKASYNIDSGELTVQLPKETPGQHFPDLDLVTKLLTPSAPSAAQEVEISSEPSTSGPSGPLPAASGSKPLIEVFETTAGKTGGDMEVDDDEEAEFDWNLPQELPDTNSITGARYGFNNMYSGYSSHVVSLTREVLEVTDIDQSTPASRRAERIERENFKFDEDYYMADYMNDEEIQRLIEFKPEFVKALKRVQKNRGKTSAKEASDSTRAGGASESASAITETLSALALSSSSLSEPPTSNVDPSNPSNTSEIPQQTTSPAPNANIKKNAPEDPWLEFTEKETQMMLTLKNRE
ncbi:Hsp90 cochaperone shq1, partial [Quaeritorhiza haematococci]